jgi:hypothetical protein
MSDCITLCKGCHANEHGLVEPRSGWILVSMDDIGDLSGVCERKGCGSEIRYAHYIYHPKWGYMTVGSTCVEILTRSDQEVSGEVLNLYSSISESFGRLKWEDGSTKKGARFTCATHAHHEMRIYGKEGFYTYQIVLKVKGVRKYDFGEFVKVHGKSLRQVKELAFIALKGLTTDDEIKKEYLRNFYRSIL